MYGNSCRMFWLLVSGPELHSDRVLTLRKKFFLIAGEATAMGIIFGVPRTDLIGAHTTLVDVLNLTSPIHHRHQPPFERSVHLRRRRPYRRKTLGSLLLACEPDGRFNPVLPGALESLGEPLQPSESPDERGRDTVNHILSGVSSAFFHYSTPI